MENFKFREAVKLGLKIFAPNYQKAHPYDESGRTNRLAYVSDVVLTLYCDEKKVREDRHWKIKSFITLRRHRDVVIIITLTMIALQVSPFRDDVCDGLQ